MRLTLKQHIILTGLIGLLSACSTSHPLVDTPHLFTQAASTYPSDNISPAFQTTKADIFFMTDRAPETTPAGTTYGNQRSPSMAFGTATVTFGEDLTWEELATASSTKKRKSPILLKQVSTQEIMRFPETPLPFFVEDGEATTVPAWQAIYDDAIEQTENALRARLLQTKEKEITLFIHGFNNNFEDAALAMADVWHFTGRIGVPIFYTWPAANKGILGYFKDSESGEFTIFHLKETLRILANMPEIERIHIVAHSRGTYIATTALRELLIETRAAGKKPQDTLKIENLFLAAPDLDFAVARQRLIAERFAPAFGQTIVYINQEDGALGLSQYLLSGLRFGKLGKEDLNKSDKEIFNYLSNVSYINVKGVNSFVGHSYYRQHPGVLSDIAITIRDRLKPGEPGRPLIPASINFWTLKEDYPTPPAPAK